jgi:RNA polymerase sigma factor (sigma-70 family)
MSNTVAGAVLRHLRKLAGVTDLCQHADRQLVRRFAVHHEQDAFAALMQRHGPMVWRVCRQVLRHTQDAEDAFQATFLVLARQVGSLRKPDSVGSWLHGIAYRVSLQARAEAKRRREQTPEAGELDPAEPRPDKSWQELQQLLHEELSRLADNLRGPLVLCILEGKTQDEAARQLGWSKSTLRRRLERARDLLRLRLAGRGVALSAALSAVLLSESTAPAAMPVLLFRPTLQAGLLLAAGKAALTDVAPGRVAVLTQGMTQAMTLTKMKIVTAVLLAFGLLAAGAGALAQRALVAQPPEVKLLAADKETASPKAEDDKKPRTDRFGDPLPEGAVARLGTSRWRHGGYVSAAAFSPDGKVLASGSKDNIIRLWDAASGKELHQLKGHEGTITGIQLLTFSPDGKLLASVGEDQTLRLWDATTGKAARELKWRQFLPRGVFFSPDGKTLIAVTSPFIDFWEVETGKELSRLQVDKKHVICAAALSPDGKSLAWASAGVICVWEVPGGKEVHQLKIPQYERPDRLAFSPDGKLLLSSGLDGDTGKPQTRVWDTATGKELRQLNTEFGPITLAFTPEGHILANYIRGKFRVWDPATGKVLREFSVPGPEQQPFTLSPDGKTFASWGSDHVLRLWDFATGKEVSSELHAGHVHRLSAVALSPDGKLLATSGGDEETARLWDVATGTEVPQINGPPDPRGSAVAFSPDGKTLAVTPMSWDLQLWDTGTGEPLFIRPQRGPYLAPSNVVVFSSDGKRLTAALSDGTIRAWQTETGKELRQWQGKLQGTLRHLAFSPDGRLLASADSSSGVYIFEAALDKQVRRLKGDEQMVSTAAFSPNGILLATAGYDATIRLWEVNTGMELGQLRGHEGKINSVAFSPGGKMVASGGQDGTVRLWEVFTGKEARRFTGHRSSVTSVAFAADGKTLASGSEDTTALDWDTSGIVQAGLPQAAPATEKELEALWADLAGKDRLKAYQAVVDLTAAHRQALPFLKGRIRPVVRDEDRLARLIGDLDSADFEVRQKATAELEALAEIAGPALRKALEDKPSLETRKRIETLIGKLAEPVLSNERARLLRVIAILKQLGTPEARQVLEVLARGTEGIRETEAAKAALEGLPAKP